MYPQLRRLPPRSRLCAASVTRVYVRWVGPRVRTSAAAGVLDPVNSMAPPSWVLVTLGLLVPTVCGAEMEDYLNAIDIRSRLAEATGAFSP